MVKGGIKFYNSNGAESPLSTTLGGTGVTSLTDLKKELDKLGSGSSNYLPLNGGVLNGDLTIKEANLTINGALYTTDSNKAITLTGNNFTYNGNDVLVFNKNIVYSSEKPKEPPKGLIWLEPIN